MVEGENRILSLEQEEGVIEGEDKIIKYITNFYKKLFGQPDLSTINLNTWGGAGDYYGTCRPAD